MGASSGGKESDCATWTGSGRLACMGVGSKSIWGADASASPRAARARGALVDRPDPDEPPGGVSVDEERGLPDARGSSAPHPRQNL
ncbi:MAG: hypothetical protein OEN21_16420 [Myxococcales bacterium]|nr:hypothetical protein [Myxococcales bacterium]